MLYNSTRKASESNMKHHNKVSTHSESHPHSMTTEASMHIDNPPRVNAPNNGTSKPATVDNTITKPNMYV